VKTDKPLQEKPPRRGQLLAVCFGLWIGLSVMAIYLVGWLEGIALGSLVLGSALIYFGAISKSGEETIKGEETATEGAGGAEAPPKEARRDNQSKNTGTIRQSLGD
jgi:hypothetical protein